MKTLRVRGKLLALLLALLLPAAAMAALPTFGNPHLVADLTPGAQGSMVRFILPTPHGAVFQREPEPFGTPPELWTTDGTPAGTFLVQPAGLELPHAPIVWLTRRFVYFEGADAATGERAIWRTDGTLGGTLELAGNLVFGLRARALGDDGLLVFLAGAPAASPGDVDLQLWASDGTPAGTHEIRDFSLQPFGVVGTMVEHGGAVYYLDLAPGESFVGLWRTDGTVAGTELVATAPGSSFQQIWATSSGLHLVAKHYPELDLSLWTSDGTAGGTHEVLPLGQAVELSDPAYPLGELADGRSIWRLYTRSIPPSLWVSDGTAAGAAPILDLVLNDFDQPDLLSTLVPLGDLGYFVANDGVHGRELWRTDGTPEGTEVAIETAPGAAGRAVGMHALQDLLYLALDDPDIGVEPRVSDGTSQGARLLGDLCPGPCSSSPFSFVELSGGAIFLAESPDFRYQLWATDLTAQGTVRLTDLDGGVSFGPQIRLLEDQVLFVADDGTHGNELWTLPFTSDSGTPPPPPGPWLRPGGVPGFEAKVRITPQSGVPLTGSLEPGCIPETLCVSGALPGRSEVFVRVVGPKPNGFLWPTLVKFTTSQVEAWIRQIETGITRYYLLEGARPGFDELPGLFDRTGFEP